ncbi:MAG: hypothetical protein KAH25_04850 [Bacteroidales bacterium]|nr:hypothetical protein [Bacteroidales bacterium]
MRPEHKRWHGITRTMDDPFWKNHYPPNDWGCRCTVQQVAKGTPITPEEKMKDTGNKPPKAFRFNADQQKLIYSNEPTYLYKPTIISRFGNFNSLSSKSF